ncbi:unnamed protein product [Anisakis simplex]|uniref:Uncharacterized protein n=1 Tax=Anisakis simplex TaxID=6269 RepID=A0A3P6NU01_ANISI|nr:unnamed protein product [Anisakis simplex]
MDMPDNEMSVDMELSHWYAHVNNMASDTADGQSSDSHVNAEKKPPKYVAFF